MPRGATQNLNRVGSEAEQRSGQINSDRLNAMNTVVPALQQEVTNPQGFSQPGLIAMRTANAQGVGGSTAGAVGQGNLEAARTRNAGGFQPAMDEAAREGERTLSQNELNVEAQNEMQRQRNRQAGISGLTGVYNTDTGATLQALGLANNAYSGAGQASAATDAAGLGWAKLGLNAAGLGWGAYQQGKHN